MSMLESEHRLFSVKLSHIPMCLLACKTQLAVDDSASDADRFPPMSEDQRLSCAWLCEMYILAWLSAGLYDALKVCSAIRLWSTASRYTGNTRRLKFPFITVFEIVVDLVKVTLQNFA